MTEPLNKVSQRFKTPLLDSLLYRKREFVLAYCQYFDPDMAAQEAGYRNQTGRAVQTLIPFITEVPTH